MVLSLGHSHDFGATSQPILLDDREVTTIKRLESYLCAIISIHTSKMTAVSAEDRRFITNLRTAAGAAPRAFLASMSAWLLLMTTCRLA